MEPRLEVFLSALNSLTDDDLDRIIFIRNQGHTVLEAINRQLAHYPYHIGQIVFIGKMYAQKWDSLSIPKGNSSAYNHDKFSKPKKKEVILQMNFCLINLIRAISRHLIALFRYSCPIKWRAAKA